MKAEDQSAERDLFEKWASDKMRGVLRVDSWLTPGGEERTGYYCDAATAWSWAAWRAALSAREAPALPKGLLDTLPVVAYGYENTRPTEKQPLMMVKHTNAEDQYPELAVPLVRLSDVLAITASAPAPEGWQDIASAPKDETPVDLWCEPQGERLVNMRRVELALDNVFYESVEAGPCAVRDATHWMPIPASPVAASPQAPTTDPAPPAAKAVEMDADKLHAAILNLPMKPGWSGNDLALYAEGHRDARHAAAEIVLAALSKQGGKA